MTTEAWIALGVTAGVFAFLAVTRIAPYLVIMGGVVVLSLAGVLSPADVLAGFANEGMITVAALFIVVAGLKQTGVLAYLMQRVLGRPQTALGAQARLALPVMTSSAFLNNTPLVAMLMSVVVEWSKTIRVSASLLLIPLSYIAVLGGLCSLIGTSTNLVVNGLLIQSGRDGMSLFDITPLGLPVALVGLGFLLIFGRKLLPAGRAAAATITDPREYTLEMLVSERGPLVGKSIQQAGLRHLAGVYLIEVNRQGQLIPAVGPDEVLQGGDHLVFAGMVDAIVDLQKIPGLAPATNQVFKLESPRVDRVFAEAVVSGTSSLVGQTIRDGRFRTRFNAVVLAVARNGERIRGRIGDITLRPGDALFLETAPAFVEQQRNAGDFYLVSKLDGDGPPTRERASVALAILVGMIIVAAFGWLTMLQAALVAGALMLLTRCCSEETARRNIDLSLLIAIAAALGLGRALEKTGAAQAIAGNLLAIDGVSPWVALAIIYGITMVLTEMVTNNAAAVIMFPIAMATANQFDVSYLPFVMSIMVAASAGFATPIGYQTHLMVYGAGGYRFMDFVRIGVPMDLLLWAATVAIAPLVWPF